MKIVYIVTLRCLTIALMLTSASVAAQEPFTEAWWQSPWVKSGANSKEVQRQLGLLIKILGETSTGDALLAEAQRQDPKFRRRFKVGAHSITETVFSRSFSLENGQETLDRENFLSLSRSLNRRDAVLDLGHELTHFLFRKPSSPYAAALRMEGFIREGIEGRGGELDAFVMECRISWELEQKMNLPPHPLCNRYRLEKAGPLALDRESVRLDYYRVGNHAAALRLRGLSMDELSGESPIFTSSFAKSPYPLALSEEFSEVRKAACMNNERKSQLIQQEWRRLSAKRALASLAEANFTKEQKRLERFSRENCQVREIASSRLKKIKIQVGRKKLEVEIAKTQAEQERGLMERLDLPEGTGMLFVYEKERELVMWMKNTRIALDVGFFAGDGSLINVHTMKPDPEGMDDDSRPRYGSSRPAKYALEVPAGWFGRMGIKAGAKLKLPK